LQILPQTICFQRKKISILIAVNLTIHTVDSIDEVLKFALESDKSEDILEMPPIWTGDKTSADISVAIE
jgi:hypothetical protein